jgi:integral membrane sensor domain MASE1
MLVRIAVSHRTPERKMKNILAILVMALLIASVLSAAVFLIFGHEQGALFARFIAVPAGLAGAGVLYLIYTAVRKRSDARNR